VLAAGETRAVQLCRVNQRRQSLPVSTIQAASDSVDALMTSRLLQLVHVHRVTVHIFIKSANALTAQFCGVMGVVQAI